MHSLVLSERAASRWIFPVFLASGFASLLYQAAWQRALFTLFGTNIESVTVVVTAFMLGLGVGSLAGGWLSARPGVSRLRWFAGAELGVGAFGLVSLPFIDWVGLHSMGWSTAAIGVVSFLLVLVPTTLMGGTLPLLVAYLVGMSGNVGRSVGGLYFINTLGAALGCFAAAGWMMGALGLSGTVLVAAGTNVVMGSVGWFMASRMERA